MTDISELVQRIEYAAHEEIMCREASDQSDLWVDIITPENILALTEALETRKQYYESIIADGSKRIAELEDRTVKLPPLGKWINPEDVQSQNRYRILVKKELDTLGIKWESE